MRISSTAWWASRLGRKPYAHGWKSASKMGSKTRRAAVWTTRSRTVGIPRGRSPPAPLGDQHTPDGVGPVGVRPEFLGETREERSDAARLYSGNGGPVNTGGTPIASHHGPGLTQDVRPVDLVVEEVEPKGRFLLGLAVQLPLEIPHAIWRFQPHGNPPASAP